MQNLDQENMGTVEGVPSGYTLSVRPLKLPPIVTSATVPNSVIDGASYITFLTFASRSIPTGRLDCQCSYPPLLGPYPASASHAA